VTGPASPGESIRTETLTLGLEAPLTFTEIGTLM
jgi:hypothetical protein